jgi:hypothetical protein
VNTKIGVLLAAALAASTSMVTIAADQAAATTAAKPAAAAADKSAPFVKEALHQMTATVEAISMDTREVTLRGKDGHTETIKVGPEARNLGQVKVGDRVTVSYYESLTAQMRLHDKPNEGFQTAAGAVRAGAGERPGGAAAQSVASTVTIDSIDPKANTVTFHRPDNGVSTIPIRSEAGRKFVSKLKPGDVVDVMYTEALAIDVTQAKEKSK